MHTLKRLLLSAGVVSMATAFMVAPVQAADVQPNDFWGGNEVGGNVQNNINLGNRDPREIAAQVINILLGFLGIIAVIIILAGGFKWMTAGGNQDKVDEAKKLMSAGVIGLIIVLASFGIAQFIINSLVSATTSTGTF